MSMNPIWLQAFVAAILLLFCQQAAPATDLSGCWSGRWQSCTTPHNGPLQAEFVRLDQSHYEVFFNGRFFKLLPFRYSVVMIAIEQDGAVSLSGSQFLGRMFGRFTFQATASECEFNATYSSCKDHGLFTLTRCCTGPSCP
jgi:hypothetical protein